LNFQAFGQQTNLSTHYLLTYLQYIRKKCNGHRQCLDDDCDFDLNQLSNDFNIVHAFKSSDVSMYYGKWDFLYSVRERNY